MKMLEVRIGDKRLLRLIEREIRRAQDGQPALVRAKMNALVDERMIDALYRASAAGVRVQLNVRGICVLRPGVKGLSEHIEVVSIVGRFLEHARIFHFQNGGEDEVFLASADWMPRNLDRRVEALVRERPAEWLWSYRRWKMRRDADGVVQRGRTFGED